jgi:hypothetical protein
VIFSPDKESTMQNMQLTHRGNPRYTTEVRPRLPAHQPPPDDHWAAGVDLQVPPPKHIGPDPAVTSGKSPIDQDDDVSVEKADGTVSITLSAQQPTEPSVPRGDEELSRFIGNLSLLKGDDIDLEAVVHPDVRADMRAPLAQHAWHMKQQNKMLKELKLMNDALAAARSQLGNAMEELAIAKSSMASSQPTMLIDLENAITPLQSHVDRLAGEIEAALDALAQKQSVIQRSQTWLVQKFNGENPARPSDIEPHIDPLAPPDVIVPSVQQPRRIPWATGIFVAVACIQAVAIYSAVGLDMLLIPEVAGGLAVLIVIGAILDCVRWRLGT